MKIGHTIITSAVESRKNHIFKSCIQHTRVIVDSLRSYLAVVTVRQYPVLLCGMEEQAQYIEVNGMLLKACPFIWTDENSALYLWVAKHHYLKYRGPDEVYGIRRGRERERQRYRHLAAILKKTVIWCQDWARKWSDREIKGNREMLTFCLLVGQTYR